MELELKKAGVDGYETGGEVTAVQEETAETIVPDYCPDIARVIDSGGAVYLHSREIRDSKAELRGSVQVTVLYTPEGESGIRSLEYALPFTIETENRVFAGCQILSAEVEIEYLEARMLNPRKLFTHCKLVARMTAYRKKPMLYSTGVEADERLQVESRLEKQRAVILTQISRREFTFNDELTLSPGRPGAMELLSAQAESSVTETRIIGNKLIFKGIFTIDLLYRAEDGTCCSCTGELPYSQIMDVENAAEDASVSVQVQLTGADFQIESADPDGRQIGVTLYLYATALLRQEQEIELLSDLYSTAYELKFDSAPLNILQSYDCQTRRQPVRETLEIGVVADMILSVRVNCGPVSVSREGRAVTLRTTAVIRALYRDEGGVTLVAERRTDITCPLDLSEECTVTACASCAEEPQGSIGERGIEVRFPVDFRYETACSLRKTCVTAAELDTDTPKDMSGAPSLVLRCPGSGETAWDLAKACNSTVADIFTANRLPEDGDIPHDRLLLIPRRRA